MNPNETQMNTPMTPPQAPQTPSPEHKSLGGLIGIVVIIGILLVGGLYIWGKTIVENGADTTTDAQTEALNSQSSSTKASDIEADLNATNLEGLDAELTDINAAIQ